MELIDVNPADLLVDRNVREAQLDEVFLASIRDLGVLVPVVAVRASDEGKLRVRYGHRRTLAAVAVGLDSVRVVVVGDDADGDAAADAQRVIEQWAENEHRAGLSVTEQVGAVEQLAALGLPADEIARRTHTAPERVAAALKVAQAPHARAVLAEEGEMDLLQAAVLAEFDDDPAIVDALTQAAGYGRLEHEAQRYRDARAVAAETARLEAALLESGVSIAAPEDRDDAVPLQWLRDADGELIAAEDHATCPGATAWVTTLPSWQWRLEADEDQPVTGRCQVWHACTDPTANGHQDVRVRGAGGTRPAKLADLPEEEREAERARRRDVIDSNKAWESAEAVRRRWLAEHVPARKTAPKGTAAFLARLLVEDPQVLTHVGGNHYAAELLGQSTPQYGRARGIADLAGKASDARALVLVLTHALACCEDSTDRDDWRTRRATTVIYLQFLASMGYTLSDVETRAVKL